MARYLGKLKQPKSNKRVQTRDRKATRQALLLAGEKLFAAHGFSGTTLDMLSAEAGVNKALVSYYFGGKEGLYDAVIAANVSNVLAEVSAKINDEGDPVRNFRIYIRALAEAFAARPTFPAILMREFIGGSMQDREEPFEDLLQFYLMTEKLYEAGRKQKLFRKFDPHKLHLSIVGPLVHFVLTMRYRELSFERLAGDIENPTISAFSLHLEHLILDGMRRSD